MTSQTRHPAGPALVSAGLLCLTLVIPWETRSAGNPAQLPAANAAASFGDLQWRNIGPAVVGGRVAAVAGSDRDPYLYYLGAAGGGVWRTTDGGLTWQDVFTRQGTSSIGAIAVAPSDPRIVWVGTGESNPRNDASLGNGVWVSTDGGHSWHAAGLRSPAIARILINRRNPGIVLVGALGDPYRDSRDRGVFVTTDGGKTWRQTLYVGPASGMSDLAWDHQTNRLVFAGVWQFRRLPWTFRSGGPADGLYRSRDGGITWQRLTGHGLPAGFMGRIGVAVAASNPRCVYALIQSRAGLLWRSDDGGDHWHLVSKDTYLDQRPFYMSRLAVDPHDPNHIFFLSEDLVESHDGGVTLVNNVHAVHQDHHDMWIADDGRRMIEANDGGAPISLDGGKTWDWRFNVTLGQAYHVAFDLDVPYHVCGGFQDNDAYCGPSDSLNPLGILNDDWTDVGSDGDGSWSVPDPQDGRYIWNVGVRDLNGQLTMYDRRTRESYDVTPYVRDTNGAPLAGLPYRFNWEAPVAFSPQDGRVAYYGGNVVWESRDRGRHWVQISPDLTLNDPAHQQAAGGPINTDVSGAEFYDTLLDLAPSPRDAKVIWVGTDDGLVRLTRDGGLTWRNVSPPAPHYGRVEAVEPSPFAAGTAFAVVDRHLSGDQHPYLFGTSDFGAHWTLLAGDLPSDEVLHVVRQDRHHPAILYAGGEHGVWVTVDGGTHWRSLNLRMPAVAVYDLRIQPVFNDLIAATHGRGFWILDDLTAIEDLAVTDVEDVAFYPPRPAYTYFRWWRSQYGVGAGECCAPQGDFAAPNPPPGALLTYYLPRPLAAAPHVVVQDAAGRAIAHLTGTNHAGINRVAWDLSDDPPIPWKSAPDWNKGPSSGPLVVPGVYRAVLQAGGTAITRSVIVRPDPRAPWRQADYVARRRFLETLYGWLSGIDDALNHLDDERTHLQDALGAATAARASASRTACLAQRLAEARGIEAALSSNPRNSEDNQWRPDRLRERLQTLTDVYAALSQGPPLAPHLQEANAIGRQFSALMSRYRALMASVNDASSCR